MNLLYIYIYIYIYVQNIEPKDNNAKTHQDSKGKH